MDSTTDSSSPLVPPAKSRSFPALPRLRGLFRLVLLLPLVVVVAVSYGIKEFYPLSAFPMYKKFEERSYYSYVRDANGEPLATVPTFQLVASDVHKHYREELDRLKEKYKGSHYDWSAEQRGEAAKVTLQYLAGRLAEPLRDDPAYRKLQFVDVRIFKENRRPVTREQVVAELDLSSSAATPVQAAQP